LFHADCCLALVVLIIVDLQKGVCF
jgi:hypothetical protein